MPGRLTVSESRWSPYAASPKSRRKESVSRQFGSPKSSPRKVQMIEKLVQLTLAYRQELSDAQLRVYLGMLKCIPEAKLDAVFSKAMADSPQFMPTAPGIIAAWRSLTTVSESMDADVEFARAMNHCERFGIELYGGEPELSLSPAGWFAFRQLGGRAGFMRTMEQFDGILRKNFIGAFEKYVQ